MTDHPSTALAVINKELGRGGALCKEFNRVSASDNLDWKIEKAYAMEMINNSESLQRCDPASIGRSLIDLSVMGLSLSPALKEAYLIPYNITIKEGGRQRKQMMCSASPSYMGLEQILYRTGLVTKIETDVIREKDIWEQWSTPAGKEFKHIPAKGDRGEVIGAWCAITMTSGEIKVEVMDQKALEGAREAAARKNGGRIPFVWTGPFKEEMYKKCPLRRAFKHMPKSRDPRIMTMLDAVERTDPVDFSANDATIIEDSASINEQQVKELIQQLEEAGYPERGYDRQLQGLAAGLGYQNIRKLPTARFEEAMSLMKRGIERWKERVSPVSNGSGSAPEGTTQPTAEAS